MTGRAISQGSATWDKVIAAGLKPILKTSSYREERMSDSEREKLYRECGDECFLIPEKKHYVVCQPPKCERDCSKIADAMHKAEIVAGQPQRVGSDKYQDAKRAHAIASKELLACGKR